MEKCPFEGKDEPLLICKTGESGASNVQGGRGHELRGGRVLYPALSSPALLLPAPHLLEASRLNSEQHLLDCAK